VHYQLGPRVMGIALGGSSMKLDAVALIDAVTRSLASSLD